MLKSPSSIKAVLLAIGFSVASASAAFAADEGHVSSSYLMAYADPEAKVESPFGYFEESEEAHELNDAWLGMPAISKEGQLVGVVSDAWIDAHGYVSEISLYLSGRDYTVLVEGSQLLLWDTVIAIDLPANTIASLKPADNGLMISAR